MTTLAIRNLTKSYGAVRALDGVSFTVNSGEVRGLVGENGSGKSTTIGILAGAVAADDGDIFVGGRQLTNKDVAARNAAGVGVVFQHPKICLNMTVAENLFAGRLPTRFGIVHRHDLERRAQAVLDRNGLPLLAATRAARLSVSEQHLLEVGRVLAQDADVIAFDETTASLTGDQVQIIFRIIEQRRAAGAATIFVSHRLDEVMHICDSITVLRDGQLISTLPKSATSLDDLVTQMVGRDVSQARRPGDGRFGAVRLSVRDMRVRPDAAPVNLEIRSREIVGIAGLVGSGRTTLLRAMFGLHRRTGNVAVDTATIKAGNPRAAISAGIGFVPEDRHSEGLALTHDITLNATMVRSGRSRLSALVSPRTDRSLWALLRDRMSLRASSPRMAVSGLSGGNQQKVVLSRWLHDVPRVLLLDEPTRGIDVGAKQEIYEHIDALRHAGTALLIVSSELQELQMICDRILVLREGEVSGEFCGDAPSSKIGMAMALDGRPNSLQTNLKGEN